MSFGFNWNYGFLVGFLIADVEEAAEDGLEWGVALMLGILTVFIEKRA